MSANQTPEIVLSKGHSRSIPARLLEEIRQFLVLFLYLWVLFGVFTLHERIILHQRHLDVVWDGFAFVNALVLGKVMLVAEDINFGRWLPRRPLLLPIVLDALILAALFILFHFVEAAIVSYFKGPSAEAHGPLGGGGIGGLLSVAAILFISLIPFFAFSHVSRELGPGRLKAMLLGTKEGAT